jgi:hypothetical protein
MAAEDTSIVNVTGPVPNAGGVSAFRQETTARQATIRMITNRRITLSQAPFSAYLANPQLLLGATPAVFAGLLVPSPWLSFRTPGGSGKGNHAYKGVRNLVFAADRSSSRMP